MAKSKKAQNPQKEIANKTKKKGNRVGKGKAVKPQKKKKPTKAQMWKRHKYPFRPNRVAEDQWSLRKCSLVEALTSARQFDLEEFRRFCVASSVQPDVAQRYCHRWTTLNTFARAAFGAPYVNERSFYAFVKLLYDYDYSSQAVEDYRSAMCFYMRAFHPNDPAWYEESQFRNEITGLKKVMKYNSKRPRGPITEERLRQLFPKLSAKYRLGALLAYLGMLRHADLAALRVCDVIDRSGQRKSAWLALFGSKWRDPMHQEFANVSEAAELVWDWVDCIGDGNAPLFDDWDPKEVNEQISAAAVEFQWNPELFFSFHSLRHGRAVDLRADGEPIEELRCRGRWTSQAQQRYEALEVVRTIETNVPSAEEVHGRPRHAKATKRRKREW